MKEIFEAIKRELSKIDEIVTIDLFNNQMDKDEEGQLDTNVIHPSVYISFENIRYNQLRSGLLSGEADVILRISIESGALDALEVLEIRSKILGKIHLLKDEKYFGSLTLVEETMPDDYERVCTFIQKYTVLFNELSAYNRREWIEKSGITKTKIIKSI